MLHSVKMRLYFLVAAYFGFWAKFVLQQWQPRIIVITGSSGKTTLLHMVEAQIGDKAIYSHHANSAIGIPFHILGMATNVSSTADWLTRFIKAPFLSFRQAPHQKIYVVEADCDRPNEGKFSSRLLRPEVSMWVSVSNTHSMNFDRLVKNGSFSSHDQAIAHEFGQFALNTSQLVIANGDLPLIVNQLTKIKSGPTIKLVHKQTVKDYRLKPNDTLFKLTDWPIRLPGLHPIETAQAAQMVNELLKYLNLRLDPDYTKLQLPPGRSNTLRGIHRTTLIDSTYNTGLGATIAMLELFRAYPAKHKWLVVGDILEQGSVEKAEHERLAKLLLDTEVDRIILLGRRTKTHTMPLLEPKLGDKVVACDTAGQVLDFISGHIKGGETILFKGAQGLEGVIEQLLADPNESAKLVRREDSWIKRRQAWGLPK